MEKKFNELNKLNEIIGSFISKGQVHPFFDAWAKFFAAPFARYLLPESIYSQSRFLGTSKWGKVASGWMENHTPRFREALHGGRVSIAEWMKQYARRDYVNTGVSPEKLTITGHNAKTAINTGTADILMDIGVQYFSRRSMVDPRERTWGNTAHHIDLTPGKGEWGVHFDLVAHTILAFKNWYLGMPVNFAKISFNHGSSSKVSYFTRMQDGLIRSYGPVNLLWGIPQSLLAWGAAREWVMADYRRKEGDNLDLATYEELETSLRSRTTSMTSVMERMAFDIFADEAYISPQRYMQTELNGIINKITGGPGAQSIVNRFVMPITTGWFYYKWWPDYFGATNPSMIELLRRFKAEGVLEKIDKKGFTDVGTWTLHEVATYSSLITLLEMQKLEKEKPFPQGNMQEIAEWYGLLYARLSRGQPEPQSESEVLERISSVKMTREAGVKFEYEKEAKTLLEGLDAIQSQIRSYPIAHSKRKVFLSPMKGSVKNILQKNIQAALDDAIKAQAPLVQAINVLKENKGSFDSLSYASNMLTVVDSVLLADFLLKGAVMELSVGFTSGVAGSWLTIANIFLKDKQKIALAKIGSTLHGHRMRFEKWLKALTIRLGNPVVIASTVPLYFWLGEQVKSHGKIQGIHADLLEELQTILFELTRTLTRAQVALAYEGQPLDLTSKNLLEEYYDQIQIKKKVFSEILVQTKDRNESLQKERIYRIPRVLADYAPVGMGIGLLWMGGSWTLFKLSKGFSTQRVDKFAPGMVKFGIVLWLAASHVADGLDQEVALTTKDFLKLNKAYFETLIEEKLIERVLNLRGANPSVSVIDFTEASLKEAIMGDEVLEETLFYENQLLEVLKNVEAAN